MSEQTFVDPSLGEVLAEVVSERIRQDAKWGEQNCPDFEWVSILGEEFGEVAKAANEANFITSDTRGDYRHLRLELIQMVAVGVAYVQAIDRRGRL